MSVIEINVNYRVILVKYFNSYTGINMTNDDALEITLTFSSAMYVMLARFIRHSRIVVVDKLFSKSI